MTVLIYYDAVYNILQVYVFTGVLLFCLVSYFLFFVCVWLLLWQTTGSFSKMVSLLLVLLVSFIRLKIWIGFHFVYFLLFFYTSTIFLEFLPPSLLFFLFYCIARNGVVLLLHSLPCATLGITMCVCL